MIFSFRKPYFKETEVGAMEKPEEPFFKETEVGKLKKPGKIRQLLRR